MREGIKLSRRLASSESFAKYKGEEIFPGDAIQTDDELDEYIRNVRNFEKHSISVLQVFSIILFFLMILQDFYLSLLLTSPHPFAVSPHLKCAGRHLQDGC